MEQIWLKHYQQGIPKEIDPALYESLVDLFNKNCAKFSANPALSNLGYKLSYQRWGELSRIFACYLQQILQLKKGDRIAIMLPNILQYPVVLFGALQAGLVVVNINPLYTPRELIEQVNDAGAETVVVLANFAHTVEAALTKANIKHVIVTELADLLPAPKAFLINAVVRYIKRLVPRWSIPHAVTLKNTLAVAQRLIFNPVTIQGDDLAFLQYTGGTTGGPKGVMLTHRNMVANVLQTAAWMRPALQEKLEVIVTALPLYHIFSLTANLLAFQCFGGLNVLITNPRDIAGMVAELAKVPFTIITGVNTLFNALLNNSDFTKLNFSRLKIALGGGMAVQRVVAERWQKLTGKALLEGYGLTEASPVVCVCPLNLDVYKGSIGLPVPSTEVTFRNEAGLDVPLGETGELCVKGPQVMRGYWHRPEETKQAFSPGGWLLTGDIARMDSDGFVYIVERKKDIILVSGFNVYPNEIEDVIAAYPGVKEVAVIGVPDEHTGEAVKAFVVKHNGFTAEDLHHYCHENLTGYKRPKSIEFRDVLPKTAVGKILRRELRG